MLPITSTALGFADSRRNPVAHEDHEVALLNSLIETTMDSVEGYRESADKAANHELKGQLAERAMERLQVVAMLRDQVLVLGGEPRETGGILGGAHRMFVNLKSVVAARDEDALLEEIRRGETHLINRLDEALADRNASPDTREVIAAEHGRISAGYGKMLALVSQRIS
jgi:uncharacterized protein (TIGR02284 family)